MDITRYAYRVLDRHGNVQELDVVLCRNHAEKYLRAFLMLGVNPVRTVVNDGCITCRFEEFDARPSERARRLAIDAHRGQTDKGGQAYIGHPARIATAMEAAGYGYVAQAVAWLHDVVEDTAVTLEDLAGEGFGRDVIEAVDAISQRKKEKAPDYYARVMAVPLAHAVKWYDVADNSSAERMAKLSPETQARLAEKYVRAREWLGGPGPLPLG